MHRLTAASAAERGSGQDMALLAWSAGCLRQGQLVEAAILHLPGHTVSRLQNVDLCHLLWAVAHMNVAVEPELLLRFSVSPTPRCSCTAILSQQHITIALCMLSAPTGAADRVSGCADAAAATLPWSRGCMAAALRQANLCSSKFSAADALCAPTGASGRPAGYADATGARHAALVVRQPALLSGAGSDGGAVLCAHWQPQQL